MGTVETVDKECDSMKLDQNELKAIHGGEISFSVILGIGSIVSFVIGLIDGFVHPKACE